MPSDLPLGTIITVSTGRKPDGKNFAVAGDTLMFSFQFPDGNKDYKGNFHLMMGYNAKHASHDVNIYFLNKDGSWTKQNGVNNKEARQIKMTASDFSGTYGMFASINTDTTDKPIPNDGEKNTDKQDTNDKSKDKTVVPTSYKLKSPCYL